MSARRNKSKTIAFVLIRQCLVLTPTLLVAQTPSDPNQAQSLSPPLAPPARYQAITAAERGRWFVNSLVAPNAILGGAVSAALGTGIDSPGEYGPMWSGFGKRFGMRLTGLSVGNSMEDVLGAWWGGEDPRYFRASGRPFKARVGNILRFTMDSYRSDGSVGFGYARLAGNIGNNFLSNTWRARSEADWQHALIRVAEGVGVSAASNAFAEFWPSVKALVRRKMHPAAP